MASADHCLRFNWAAVAIGLSDHSLGGRLNWDELVLAALVKLYCPLSEFIWDGSHMVYYHVLEWIRPYVTMCCADICLGSPWVSVYLAGLCCDRFMLTIVCARLVLSWPLSLLSGWFGHGLVLPWLWWPCVWHGLVCPWSALDMH